MIDIENLHKSFGDVHVLKGIDLNIKEKEVVAIIGPSGSGKSTLLRCMNYLEEPTQGNVSVDGILLDGEANINKVREEVGMVFQRFNLFPHMTVLQNIMLAPMKVRQISRSEAEERLRNCWIVLVWLTRQKVSRASCLAVSSSVWRLPEHWR
jgi:polar amino acid transport system ATP-binding protein